MIFGLEAEMVCQDNHDFVLMNDEHYGFWPLPYLYPGIMGVVIFCLNCLFIGIQLPSNWVDV